MNFRQTFLFFIPSIFLLLSFNLVAQELDSQFQVELPDESEWPEEIEPPQSDPPPVQDPSPFEPVAPAPVGPPAPATPPPAATPPPPVTIPPPASIPPPAPAPAPQVYPPAPTQQPPPISEAHQPTLMGEAEDELAQQEKESILQWFTVSPQVGYLFFPQSTLEVKGLRSTVDARNGFIGKFHFDMGGDGISLEVSPFFAIEAGGITPLDDSSFGASSASLDSGMQAVGAQMSITYKFDVGYFFPSIGLGMHADYLMGQEIEYGTEIYGRIPVGFSIYMGKHVALTFEAAFMYGVTGIKTPLEMPAELDPVMNDMDPNTLDEFENASTPADYENWYNDHEEELNGLIDENQNELPPEYQDYESEDLMQDLAEDQLSKAIRFGRGIGLEFCIGLRFP